MSIRWIVEADRGHWLLTGRVLASLQEAVLHLLVEGRHRVQVHGEPVTVANPGDLVRVRAELETSADPTGKPINPLIPVYRALAVEVVRRPTRHPLTHGTETHRLVGAGVHDRLVLRARVFERVRRWFADARFLEVETPTRVTCPGLDVHLMAFGVNTPVSVRPSIPPIPEGYLITSPELHMKRLLVGGVERCFQLARCFRAGELGARHQPEFTMLEWYRAWATLDDVLADTEAIVRAAAEASAVPGVITVGDRTVPVDVPFERLTVREAFARHAPDLGDPVALALADEHRYYEALSARVEPHLGVTRPTLLLRFPACHASLARLCDDDPSVCERAELYVAGVELSNGFYELTDPVEQRVRFERDQLVRRARGLPVFPIDGEFLAALEEGMPPSAGNALGLDRLVALVAGVRDIADVMAFPERGR